MHVINLTKIVVKCLPSGVKELPTIELYVCFLSFFFNFLTDDLLLLVSV